MIPLSCPDMLFPVEELPSVLPKLRAMGFAAIELAWAGTGDPARIPVAKQIARMARDAGLGIGAVWVWGIQGACSADAAVRRSAIERMKPLFELAVESKAAGVVTIGHLLGVKAAPADRLEALGYLRESFSEMGRCAAGLGTRIFLESISRAHGPLLDTIDSAAEFCGSLGDAGVSVCADTYHARFNGEDFGASLARARRRIGFVHFSDFGSVAGKPDRPLPGFGELDFEEAYRAVRAIGYRGVIAIEGAIPEGMTALVACAEVAMRLGLIGENLP